MTIDAVVFDVDGVLVDTDGSYNEAVIRTLATVLPATPVDRAQIRLWRRSGDWNNDWDLSYGLYCWLSTAKRPDAATAAQSSLAELESAAGPLPFGYRDIQGIFEEHYSGTAAAVDRYGVQARVHNAQPLAAHERVLLVPALVTELQEIGITKFGVVTGRDRADWERVAGRIPLPPGTPVATDEDGRKPDPAGLELVVGKLRPSGVAVVGDTLNDLRMTRAFARVGTISAIAVMRCDADERDLYLRAGAAATISALADLPTALRDIRLTGAAHA